MRKTTLIITLVFLLGCLGITPVQAAAEESDPYLFKPPGLDKWGGKAVGVAADVYHPEQGTHPSLKGLVRAYENLLRNHSSLQAQEVLKGLVRTRGGSVIDAVYAAENSTYSNQRLIAADKELRAEVQTYLSNLQEEVLLEAGLGDPEKSGLIRSLARSMAGIGHSHSAEQGLRKALVLAPTDIQGYLELNDILQSQRKEGFNLFVRGARVDFDQPPRIENNRTLVPFRALAEALGGKVSWHPGTQTIVFANDAQTIELKVGSTTMRVNGEEIQLDTSAVVRGQRLLVPLRAIGESLGVDVTHLEQMVIVN